MIFQSSYFFFKVFIVIDFFLAVIVFIFFVVKISEFTQKKIYIYVVLNILIHFQNYILTNCEKNKNNNRFFIMFVISVVSETIFFYVYFSVFELRENYCNFVQNDFLHFSIFFRNNCNIL